MSAHLSRLELDELGVVYGREPLVSRKSSLFGAERITIGDNVRIDDFAVLSAGPGGITIGCHVHVAVFSSLIGRGAIRIGDYANLSSRVSVYSSSDDYSGEWMTNPTVPEALTNVHHADVLIGRHVIIGVGAVILPGVVLGEGAAVGALSLVRGSCEPFTVVAGVPARIVGARSKRCLELASAFESGGRAG
jgi:acetyltransferase-like isoleucine patch superfamily enzyme